MEALFFFLLDLRVPGEHGGIILTVEDTIFVVLHDRSNGTGTGENADQVGERHETVEGIGNIPGQRGSHLSAQQDTKNKDHAVAFFFVSS